MTSSTIAVVAIVGILATAASFYALYEGPNKNRFSGLVLASAVLVGGAPYIALMLGTSGQTWLRDLMTLGLASFFVGILVYLATILWTKRLASLASAIPMAGLAGWSFLFLGVFSSGVV